MKYSVLVRYLSTEEQCRKYLAKLRWREGFCCPRCNNTRAWETAEQKYKCTKCGYKISVTSGTIFEDSHVPLNKWFLAIWKVSENRKYTFATQLQKELGLGSNRTALRMAKYINRARYTTTLESLENASKQNLRYKFILLVAEIEDCYIGQINIFQISATTTEKNKIVDYIKSKVVKEEREKWKKGIICKVIDFGDSVTSKQIIINQVPQEYRATEEKQSDFTGWTNINCTLDEFDKKCARPYVRNFQKYEFEEILGNILYVKAK